MVSLEVAYWRNCAAYGVRCYVPSWAEDEEVRKRGGGVAGWRGEDAEDGGVDMVDYWWH